MSLQLDDLNLLEAPEQEGGGKPRLMPIDAIDEDPAQPRREFNEESLRELAETIAQRGVRQPISVRPHPEQPGRWMLNFGARRLRASKLAGKSEIPAFIDETADSYDQVIENEHREGLKPIELALFVKRELEAGRSQAEIGRRLGKTRAYIAYVCALVDPPDWLLALYRAGRCRGIKELYDLRRLHDAHGNAVIEWIGDRESISRADIAEFAARSVQPLVQTPALERETEQRQKSGQTRQATPAIGKPQPCRGPVPDAAHSPPDLGSTSRGRRFVLRADVGGAAVEVLLSATPEDSHGVLVKPPDDAQRLVSPECITNLRIERS
jgi:ParB family chromosome partitioning protein